MDAFKFCDEPGTVDSRDGILVVTSMLQELEEVVSGDNSRGNDIGDRSHVILDGTCGIVIDSTGQKKYVWSRLMFSFRKASFRLSYLSQPVKIH